MRTTSVSAEFAPRGVTMTNVITQVEPAGLLVHLRPVIELTDDQLIELCQISGRWPSASRACSKLVTASREAPQFHAFSPTWRR
jgi:hypothetical protein